MNTRDSSAALAAFTRAPVPWNEARERAVWRRLSEHTKGRPRGERAVSPARSLRGLFGDVRFWQTAAFASVAMLALVYVCGHVSTTSVSDNGAMAHEPLLAGDGGRMTD